MTNPVTFQDDLAAERDRLARELETAHRAYDDLKSQYDAEALTWRTAHQRHVLDMTAQKMENNHLRAMMREVADDIEAALAIIAATTENR